MESQEFGPWVQNSGFINILQYCLEAAGISLKEEFGKKIRGG
jgi:hypothetical protein